MTFFHHLPKFPTMGLQISDHGLHKHSDFQQQIAERLRFSENGLHQKRLICNEV